MALVEITGSAWDHSHVVIPASLQPRLWAKPVASRIAGSLLAGVESRANLNLTNGSFWVRVESGLDYVMTMDWLVPGQETEPPEKRARSSVEWPVFNSGGGGPITGLYPPVPMGTITAELGPPPPGTEGIVWIDLTNVTSDGALVYAPERG